MTCSSLLSTFYVVLMFGPLTVFRPSRYIGKLKMLCHLILKQRPLLTTCACFCLIQMFFGQDKIVFSKSLVFFVFFSMLFELAKHAKSAWVPWLGSWCSWQTYSVIIYMPYKKAVWRNKFIPWILEFWNSTVETDNNRFQKEW